MSVLLPVLLLNLAALLLQEFLHTSSMHCYFTALCTALAVLYAAGVCGVMPAAAAGLWVLTAAGAAVYLVRHLRKKDLADRLRAYADPFALLYNAAATVFAVIFTLQKPLCYYWDEYSFWSVSAKYVKYYGQFYNRQPDLTFSTLPPMNSVLGYFFMYFSRDFADYKLLLAYAFLMLAVFAMTAAWLHKKTQNLPLAVGAFAVLVFSPFWETYHAPAEDYSSLSYAYGTTMVDFLIAVVFLGCAVSYLESGHALLTLPPLVYLSLMKNTSVFFALQAAALITFFAVFASGKKPLKKALSVALTLVLTMAVVGTSYLSWFWCLAKTTPESTARIFTLTEPAGEREIMRAPAAEAAPDAQPETEMAETPPQEQAEEPAELQQDAEKADGGFLSIFVASRRSQRHKQVLETMRQEFATAKITAFVPDRFLVVLLLVLGLLCAALCKQYRLPLVLLAVALAAGALVYNLTISYFIADFNDGMVEYPRYMTSYYWLWLYMVFLVAVPILHAARPAAAQLAVAALACFGLTTVLNTGLSYTVFAAPQNAYAQELAAEETAEKYRAYLTKDTRVYVPLRDQDTWSYFLYKQRLLPALADVDTLHSGVDFTISFRDHIDPDSERTYYNVADLTTFTEVMRTYFDYVLIVDPDPEFVQTYNSLFAGGIRGGVLYKITGEDVPLQEVAACD